MGKRHCASYEEFLYASGTPVETPPATGRSLIPRHLLALAVALSACANNPTGIQGRWVGTIEPVAGTCDPASQAVLIIDTGRTPPYPATFLPTAGVLALHGTSDGADQVAADLHAIGMNHQPYILSFTAARTGDAITGTYVSPRCRAKVDLHRG